MGVRRSLLPRVSFLLIWFIGIVGLATAACPQSGDQYVLAKTPVYSCQQPGVEAAVAGPFGLPSSLASLNTLISSRNPLDEYGTAPVYLTLPWLTADTIKASQANIQQLTGEAADK